MVEASLEADLKGTGVRYNAGKVPLELIPSHLLNDAARVFEYGTRKYAPWNWAKGMTWSSVIGCLKKAKVTRSLF